MRGGGDFFFFQSLVFSYRDGTGTPGSIATEREKENCITVFHEYYLVKLMDNRGGAGTVICSSSYAPGRPRHLRNITSSGNPEVLLTFSMNIVSLGRGCQINILKWCDLARVVDRVVDRYIS